MDTSTSVGTHHEPHAHDAAHEHHELGWWRKYIFSTDHKVIGIQYGLCGLVFLFFGFCLMMLMRFQLAYPGQGVPGLSQIQAFIDHKPLQFLPGMDDVQRYAVNQSQHDPWNWLRLLLTPLGWLLSPFNKGV